MAYKNKEDQVAWKLSHPNYDAERYQRLKPEFLLRNKQRQQDLRTWLNEYKFR